MIQVLLHGLKMDPLVSLHYYAPVCALINLVVLPFTEGLAPFYELARIGPVVLLSNAFVAFFLNVAAVFLVGVGSGLVLTLAGVFKVGLVLFLIYVENWKGINMWRVGWMCVDRWNIYSIPWIVDSTVAYPLVFVILMTTTVTGHPLNHWVMPYLWFSGNTTTGLWCVP